MLKQKGLGLEVNTRRKRWKLLFSTSPLSFGAPSPGNLREYTHKPYTIRNSRHWPTFLPLIVLGLSSLKFLFWTPKDASFLQLSAYRSFKVIQGRSFSHKSKGRMRFRINSNFGPLAPFVRYGELLAKNCEFFLPHSHLSPSASLGVNPFEFLDELFSQKLVLDLTVGEDFVILSCVVLTSFQRVTDRQLERQTDIPIVAITHGCV